MKSPYGEHLWLDIRHLGEEHITGKLREVYEICHLLPGRGPDSPAHPGAADPALFHGRRAHQQGRRGLRPQGAVRRGRSRLLGHARLQPAGRQLPGRDRGRGRHHRQAKIAEYLQGAETLFKTSLINDEVKKQQARIDALVSNGQRQRERLQGQGRHAARPCTKGANIFRTQEGLEKCVASLQDTLARARKVGLRSDGKGVNPELAAALKLEGQVKLALMVAYGALMRTESRGSHNREDFPARNDRDWLNRTLAYWKNESDDLPTLEYEPSTEVVEIPPGDRGYGKSEIISADSKKD